MMPICIWDIPYAYGPVYAYGVEPRGMTPLEISYACPEIKGNHDRNHWKSGNQASHQKSQFVMKLFLNTCKIVNTY